MVRESMETKNLFNLVFMDIQMPNLDGLQSTRLIREMGFSAPIVALTAFADESNARECMDSGMDYFLPKPIKRPALKQVLKRYCATIPEDPEDREGAAGSQQSEKQEQKQEDKQEGKHEEQIAEGQEEEQPRDERSETEPQRPEAANGESMQSSHPDTQTTESSEANHTTQPTSPEALQEKPNPLH